MTIDTLANWRLHANLPQLRQAFELLDAPVAQTWPQGRVALDGDRIFAMPQSYLTKPDSDGKWEAHRRYIDIQFMVSGAERMGWAPLTTMRETIAYDADKDVAFYDGHGDILTVREGMFALFFPHDVHMPTLCVDNQPQQVRKIVIKVAI